MTEGEKKDKKKISRNRLDPEVYKILEGIVGPEWISEDRAIVETYSKYSIDAEGFLKKHQKDGSNIPACIVLPHTLGEIQSIVRVLNRYRIPFSPFTNGQIVCGPTSSAPTVFLHLSRMNKILDIDEENLNMTVEPYVDYRQVQAEAMKRGLWNGGTPLSTSLTKMASQFAFAGLWQTDLKYSNLGRNIVGVEMVLPTGEILRTGSSTISNAGSFYEYGPGPDLHGLLRSSMATTGIITKVTIKLHPWVGEPVLKAPQDRPSLNDWSNPKYDRAEVPKNHRLIWIECPDLRTQLEMLYRVCHAGIGMGLNSCGVYSAYYCSQTQEMTEKRVKERFFPSYNVYVIMAAITSEKQLEYEEKVFRHIVDQVGGCKFFGPDYKPEVLEALSTWNLDFVRNIFGYRMNRRMYASVWIPLGEIDMAKAHQVAWQDALDNFKPLHITDEGGKKDTPFVYCVNRGHFAYTETDNYPDPLNPEQLATAIAYMAYGAARLVKEKVAGYPVLGLPIEPFTSFFPEVGPNTNLFLRKIRKVFDPNEVAAPGRQVFTEKEFRKIPERISRLFNSMRSLHGMEEIKN